MKIIANIVLLAGLLFGQFFGTLHSNQALDDTPTSTSEISPSITPTSEPVTDTPASTPPLVTDTIAPSPTTIPTEPPSSTATAELATDVPASATPEATDTSVTEVPTGMPNNQVKPMSAQAATALGCIGDTCTFQVNSSSDDAGPNPVYNCSYSTNWNEIYFGLCPNNTPIVSGFRFTNVTIDKRTKIAQAYLEFTVDGPYDDQVSLNFYGEATGNSSTFGPYSPPGSSTRPALTQNFTTWNISSSSTDHWELGMTKDTPDLTQVIQEITNRGDWSSGNALSIIAKSISASGANRHRRVIGYDRPVWYPGTQYAARLVIHLGSTTIQPPTIIGRAGWNCPPNELQAPYTTPVAQQPAMVVVHHTTSRNDPTQSTIDSNDKYEWAMLSDLAPGGIPMGTVAKYYDPIKDTWAGDVLMVWLVERYEKGWTDTAYHYLVDGDGNIYQGSYYGIGYEKGATCSEISDMVQVALLGCFQPGQCDREGGAGTPSSAAITSLKTLIDWLGCTETQFLMLNGGTADNIKGHRDIDNGSNPHCSTTVCPGQNLYNLLPKIRQQSSCTVASGLDKFAGFEPANESLLSSPKTDNLPNYYITVMGQDEAIYITDPEGRHLGIDPVSGNIVNEIPGADFQDNPTWGEEASRGDSITEPASLVIAHIPLPAEGVYRVQTQGILNSSEGGLSLSARQDGNLKAERMVVTEPGQKLASEYQFIYSLDNAELVSPLFQDVTPPTSTYQLAGTAGLNGWYTSNVTVTISAVDNPGGSGVLKTMYSLDGGATFQTYTGPFVISQEGTTTILAQSSDRVGNVETPPVSLTVRIDKTPPVLKVTVSPTTLWPPNHKMVTIHTTVQATDNLDSSPVVKLVSVTSNEPDNGLGDGDQSGDIVIQSDGTILLRAERSGNGNGRIYTITYSAQDAAGNVTIKSATVTVPHNQ